MIGLSGLLLTSRIGANGTWMPTARASSAVIRPVSYASAGSPVAPSAMWGGNSVAPPSSRPVGTWTAPRSRKPAPASRSAPTSSGTGAAAWRLLSFTATSVGDPTDMITPPIFLSSTS